MFSVCANNFSFFMHLKYQDKTWKNNFFYNHAPDAVCVDNLKLYIETNPPLSLSECLLEEWDGLPRLLKVQHFLPNTCMIVSFFFHCCNKDFSENPSLCFCPVLPSRQTYGNAVIVEKKLYWSLIQKHKELLSMLKTQPVTTRRRDLSLELPTKFNMTTRRDEDCFSEQLSA